MSEREGAMEQPAGDNTDDRAVGEYDPPEILREIARLQEKKNDDYGNAWELTGQTLALWCEANDVDEIDMLADAENFNSLFLYAHRLEKLIRAFNGEFMTEGELNHESLADSHEDEAGYAGMHASLVRRAREGDNGE